MNLQPLICEATNVIMPRLASCQLFEKGAVHLVMTLWYAMPDSIRLQSGECMHG